MIAILTIKEAGKYLGNIDNRTVIKYCDNNDVQVFPKRTGRGRYVYATEFYAAFHSDLLPYLEKEYGGKAGEAYEAIRSNDPIKLMMLKRAGKDIIRHSKRYIPKNARENELLEEFTKKYIS